MTVLSEKLNNLLAERRITIAQLSRNCKIDRSTLYQYLKGKRAIKSLTQLERITVPLCLTQEEQTAVFEAYDMEQMGAVRYQQYKDVGKFFSALMSVSSCMPSLHMEKENDTVLPEANMHNISGG